MGFSEHIGGGELGQLRIEASLDQEVVVMTGQLFFDFYWGQQFYINLYLFSLFCKNSTLQNN
jgi:hypothetical protein